MGSSTYYEKYLDLEGHLIWISKDTLILETRKRLDKTRMPRLAHAFGILSFIVHPSGSVQVLLPLAKEHLGAFVI